MIGQFYDLSVLRLVSSTIGQFYDWSVLRSVSSTIRQFYDLYVRTCTYIHVQCMNGRTVTYLLASLCSKSLRITELLLGQGSYKLGKPVRHSCVYELLMILP